MMTPTRFLYLDCGESMALDPQELCPKPGRQQSNHPVACVHLKSVVIDQININVLAKEPILVDLGRCNFGTSQVPTIFWPAITHNNSYPAIFHTILGLPSL